MAEQRWLWPRLRQKFFKDLRELHKVSGPWDLVLFSGDLTQSGSEEEFIELDTLLLDYWQVFKECGSSPSFLAVPGNHDLVRPAAKEDEVLARELEVLVSELKEWRHDVANGFWSMQQSRHRELVTEAFRPYKDWWEAQTLQPTHVHHGNLPGDFVATIEKGGAALGVLGLNTTFVQLAAGDYQGKLAVHPLQFHDVCNGDGPEWANRHHICLLMTHQPPAWLNPESQKDLNSEIADAGQFALHLFGHMHEALYTTIGIGAARPRRWLQGRALFGLEYFKGTKGEIQRTHGYSAGRIELQDETALLTIWPREARQLQDGTWKVVPDLSYDLVNNEHTEPVRIPLLRPYQQTGPLVPPQGNTLQSLRSRMLSASSIRELRDVLFELEAFLDGLGARDGRIVEAKILREQTLNGIQVERTLQGFHREHQSSR